jgi:hypothetical protein
MQRNNKMMLSHTFGFRRVGHPLTAVDEHARKSMTSAASGSGMPAEIRWTVMRASARRTRRHAPCQRRPMMLTAIRQLQPSQDVWTRMTLAQRH